MNYVNLLGLLAGSFTTIAYVPEVLKVWKRKSAKDLSIIWLLALFAGVSLWIAYGALIGSYPLVVTNLLADSLIVTIIALKIRYDKKR